MIASRFFRLLFYAESPATPWPGDAGEYTAFAVAIKTGHCLDLTAPALSRDRAAWIAPIDYGPCQALADAARAAGAEVIRYESARDPQSRANVAVLVCAAFAKPKPLDRRNWRIRLSAFGAQAICEHPSERLEFGRQAFARDPRIAGMAWER
jgi:hypothetical protein